MSLVSYLYYITHITPSLSKGFLNNKIQGAFPESKALITPDMHVGFIANELLDPAGCSPTHLEECRRSASRSCAKKWPMNYLVHQCLDTWRGRIGD